MTLTASQKTIRGLVAIAALFLIAIGAMGLVSYRLIDVNRWTIHTHSIIEGVKDSLSALQDVETGERGYIVTGQKNFLEPYEWGRQATMRDLAQIASMTRDNPAQQENIRKARELAQARMDWSAETIEKAVIKPAPATIPMMAKGKQIMDEYRHQVALIMQNEKDLLTRRTEDLKEAQALLVVVTVILSVVGVVLLGWIYRITSSAIEEEKKRVLQLDRLNTGLADEIEQRKQTELALKEATAKLSSSNTDLQQFAYVASHDLQEPLRAVSGFLTLLASKHKETLDEESASWINHAVEGSLRMRALINDLLAYARVESKGKALIDTDCNESLTIAKKDLSVLLGETDAQLNVADLPHVMGEKGQLAQVFQNLIGNAIKFRSSEHPVIDIGVVKQSGNWLFTIKDNGLGFDQEHAERIFVIFQRLQGREEHKGTGIGLALCKKIIERHGGTIWAQSEKGKGSTFSFTIPVIGGGDNGH
jgi:signal transduction histidine kinase